MDSPEHTRKKGLTKIVSFSGQIGAGEGKGGPVKNVEYYYANLMDRFNNLKQKVHLSANMQMC